MTHTKGFARALMGRVSYGALAMTGALALGGHAMAMQPPATPADTEVSEVVATGFRASLQNSLETKRNSDVMVDAITAEDIADFPDSNLAESLQRLPGVSIDRFDGEGRSITVRGLGGDFTRTRLNGLEALSTAGANESEGRVGGNRSRSFDYNTFASELFNSLKVQKTSSAETDEGSLGATVDLTTGRPFNFKGARGALMVQDGYYTAGGKHNPRVAALFSDRWFDGRMGLLGSFAYSKRDQTIDSYTRQAAAFDYAYRSATFASPNLTAGQTLIQRQGFAAPTGSLCNGTVTPALGVVPGQNVTNPVACAAMSGSDPTAYALVHTVIGATRTLPTGTSTAVTIAPGSLIRVPGLPTLNQQQINQERTGGTLSFQMRPQDQTLISIDGVYSKMKYDSQNFQVQTIGTNRNNTNSTFNTAAAGSTGLYSNYSCRAYSSTSPATFDCLGTQGSSTILPGYTVSRNPNNLEAYDYYNNPLSPGYIAPGPGGIANIAMLDKLIGRPSTKLLAAELSPKGFNADYVKLGNLDMRAADDQSKYITTFQQVSAQLDHEVNEDLRFTALYGQSSSNNKGYGILTDYIRLDSGQGVAGNDYYVFDERGDPDMPVVNLGFDAANPANWDFVKGYSVLRIFTRQILNEYRNGRLDFVYTDLFGNTDLKFGASARKYSFASVETRRAAAENANPTFKEAGVNIADTGRLISWGKGLDVPAGTTTTFFVPDNSKMDAVFGFSCNCINKYGDYRQSIYSAAGSNFAVTEKDSGIYMQLDYDSTLFDHAVRGNVGVRYAQTRVDASGLSSVAPFFTIRNDHNYHDVLPALNLVFDIQDNLLLRFGAAKVMSRPSLALLAPGFTAVSIPTGVSEVDGATMTAGNTKLNPIRATNYDLALEWYPSRDSTFGVALFHKDINNYQQVVLSTVKLTDVFSAADIAALRDGTTNVNSKAYINGNYDFDLKRPVDTPGGFVQGVEVNYQQNLTFLPGWMQYFGVQANYTYIKSELQYLLDPGQIEVKNGAGIVTTPYRAPVYKGGPYLNASPEAVNLTVFYEKPRWSARVSTAWRTDYATNYPIASGTCDPGFCEGPTINDFQSSKKTLNVDASFSYKITDRVSLSVEALNLTDQTDNRFAYAEDPVVTRYASSGRQFFFGIRADF